MQSTAVIEHNESLTLAAAAKLCPGSPATTTLYRWTTIGFRGLRLEHVRVGGRIYTSKAALDRFIARCTALERAAAKDAR